MLAKKTIREDSDMSLTQTLDHVCTGMRAVQWIMRDCDASS